MSQITVLYVGGVGRSGSSLIERLLDTHPEVVSLGEIHQIFSTWLDFDKRQLCGCGEEFQNCPFWGEVLQRAFPGGMQGFDPAEWRARRAAVADDRHRRQLLLGLGGREYYDQLDAFLEPIGRFYRAIAEVSGARVIVDSSKTANWALALQRIDGIDVRFLHFIRNPYATAYSWQRRKKMPEVWWEEREMPIFGAEEIGRRWRSTYLMARLGSLRFGAYKRIHYEDFVKDPARTLDEIVSFAQLPPFATPPIDAEGKAQIQPGHTIMGNPMRVQKNVTVREDDEWRRTLSQADRAAVKRLVWPLRPCFRT
ncbi:sulfotransferase [Novosphingobium profundi]|uniref:sulfotransferase n=1 Tax=Novosphingobium profundi TaxID=1774954 RepID=UPI001CFE03B2|nr:sulfotransferase [Novosphingobium profundi]